MGLCFPGRERNPVIFAKKYFTLSCVCTKTQKISKHSPTGEKICKNDLTNLHFTAIILGIF